MPDVHAILTCLYPLREPVSQWWGDVEERHLPYGGKERATGKIRPAHYFSKPWVGTKPIFVRRVTAWAVVRIRK